MASQDHHQQTNNDGPLFNSSVRRGGSPYHQGQAGLDEQQGGHTGKGGGSKNKKKKKKSSSASATNDLLKPLTEIFKDLAFPVGEVCEYKAEIRLRASTEELAERERLDNLDQDKQYRLVRQAAEAHRRVRMYARQSIKPGMTMTEVADLIENGVRTVVEAQGLERGIAFPTGLSLNECAAHYTPNPGDKRVLLDTDVLKVDIGVHVKGRICDSAFTLTFDGGRQWEPLLEAVRAATETGIKEAGIDARLGEIGAAIQETMESHECQVDGRTLPIKAIRNLCGHSIEQYRIHGSHSVPIVAEPDNVIKMIEGHYYAIETFGSTGLGYTVERGACSHYYKSRNSSSVPASSVTLFSARKLLQTIDQSFGTLPFCRRYLERAGEKNYLLGLKHLASAGIIDECPPLCDVEGSMTAQFEHTVLLRPTCKEVVSRGIDY